MPNPGKFSFRDAVLRVLTGQAQGWLARLIGLPLAAVGGVMLAFAWNAVHPWMSALHGRIVAETTARAEVVESRFVCDASAARQLALVGLDHVVTGEAGCLMREQSLLRFTDAAGRAHTVLATDPSDPFEPQDLTLPFAGDKFQSTFALLDPKTYVAPAAATLLEQIRTEVPSGVALGSGLATSSWSQLDALRARMYDPLVFTAFAWVRPPVSQTIELRYAASDPEHAWIGAFLADPSGWSRIPWSVVLALAPVGIFVLFGVARIFLGDRDRYTPALVTAMVVLAIPLWAPHLFDVMAHFAKHAETVARLRDDFGNLVLTNDGRVEPAAHGTLRALAPDATAGPIYARLLAGLIPPRPQTSPRTLGEAFDSLCAGVAERFAALDKAARDERYPLVSKLQDHGISTPGACLLPVAIQGLDDAFAAKRPRPQSEYDFLMAYVYQRGVGSSFVGDYVGSRHLMQAASAALSREIERRRE